MKIIECLSDYIHEEVHDAEKYAEKALAIKHDYPEIADLLSVLSSEELKHMQMLHNGVVKLIEAYRKIHGEPPADMQAVYDYLHKKIIEEVKEVKILQQLYTE